MTKKERLYKKRLIKKLGIKRKSEIKKLSKQIRAQGLTFKFSYEFYVIAEILAKYSRNPTEGGNGA